MAYVAPHGTIELYQNVPLTPAYEHTLWFDSEESQRAYFASKTFMTFNNQMYTRHHRNRIRIHVNSELVDRCSYLGFKNDLKWYYAFIISVEYINEQVTEITFALDNVQTWFRSASFRDCFIERQHSRSDTVGDNLQPEPVDCGEHICCRISTPITLDISLAYILSIGTVNKSANTTSTNSIYAKKTFGGIGSTVKYLYFANADNLISFLNQIEFADGFMHSIGVTNDVWAPLTVYVVPSGLFAHESTAISGPNDLSFYMMSMNVNEGSFTVSSPEYHGTSDDTYVPKNNKLLTYPYTFLEIETPTKMQNFKYETFFSSSRKFKWYSTCNPSPSFMIMPDNYNANDNDYRYALIIDDFPQLPIYSAGLWGAAGGLIGSTVKLGLTSLIAHATQAPMLVSPSVDKAANSTALVPQDFWNSEKPDDFYGTNMNHYGPVRTAPIYETKPITSFMNKSLPRISTQTGFASSGGTTNLAPILAAKGLPDFSNPVFETSALQWGLRKEYAKRIDEYFSRYGYAQNKVGMPVIHARQRYTYIKTNGCNVGGPIPAEAMRDINAVMDSGITWWADTNVGMYTDVTTGELLDNLPVGVG